MRARPVAGSVVLALAIAGLAPGGVLARGPKASFPPTQGDIALALVRAQDSRFADLPTIDEVQITMAANFDFAPALAGSWIEVSETFATTMDLGLAGPAWLDPGTGRIVEVMLVAGCPDTLKGAIPPTAPDPCAWRHTWLYHVTPDGTVTVIADAGSRDTPACYTFHTTEGITWPPDTEVLVCGTAP